MRELSRFASVAYVLRIFDDGLVHLEERIVSAALHTFLFSQLSVLLCLCGEIES